MGTEPRPLTERATWEDMRRALVTVGRALGFEGDDFSAFEMESRALALRARCSALEYGRNVFAEGSERAVLRRTGRPMSACGTGVVRDKFNVVSERIDYEGPGL